MGCGGGAGNKEGGHRVAPRQARLSGPRPSSCVACVACVASVLPCLASPQLAKKACAKIDESSGGRDRVGWHASKASPRCPPSLTSLRLPVPQARTSRKLCMYIYMYVCMYVYIYFFFLYFYISIFLYFYTYIYVYISILVYIYILCLCCCCSVCACFRNMFDKIEVDVRQHPQTCLF